MAFLSRLSKRQSPALKMMKEEFEMGLKEQRKAFYEKIDGFWPDLYGKEYALFDLFSITGEAVSQIRDATRQIGRIFWKMGELLRWVPDATLLEMGYPKALLPYLRIKPLSSAAVIARLDLTYAKGAYRCIELNADTPTFIMETHRINGLVCHRWGCENPNEAEEARLGKGIDRAVREAVWNLPSLQAEPGLAEWAIGYWGSMDQRDDEGNAAFAQRSSDEEAMGGRPMAREPMIVFTAHEESIEDRETTRYLQSLTRFPSAFIPLHQLEILRGEGLFTPDGRKIDLLYRQTYPLEQLIEDRGAGGEPIGEWLMELVRDGKLALLNPPSAFLLQNKAVQAAVWDLHEEVNPYFSEEEHALIDRHFLPTYMDPAPFRQAGKPYVQKPIFGREGVAVKIYDEHGQLQLEDPNETDAVYPSVYQEYAPLPEAAFMTSGGREKGHLLIGSFLIHGEPGAIGLRAGGLITDDLSYFLPLGIGERD